MQGITIIDGHQAVGNLYVKFEHYFAIYQRKGYRLLLDGRNSYLRVWATDEVIAEGETQTLDALQTLLAQTWPNPVSADSFLAFADGWMTGYRLAEIRSLSHVSLSKHQATPVT